MDKGKKIFAVILIVIIISMIVLIWVFKDTIFQRTMKIKYPGGCVEEYKDDILITPICLEGRLRVLPKEVKEMPVEFNESLLNNSLVIFNESI
jgi:hypothetical protein